MAVKPELSTWLVAALGLTVTAQEDQLAYGERERQNEHDQHVEDDVGVAQSERGNGTGAAMMRWAIERARERGCALVQLTTDKRRGDAHRFYRRFGFVASHEGMKLALN